MRTNSFQDRSSDWNELQDLCDRLEYVPRRVTAQQRIRMAALYRSACADLARSEHASLPPRTVDSLHQLVTRSHDLLYAAPPVRWSHTLQTLFLTVPRHVVRDPCSYASFSLFFGLFFGALFCASRPDLVPQFAINVLSERGIDQLESSFAEKPDRMDSADDPMMASFYFRHNGSIGLKCFAGSVLLIPGLLTEAFNAVFLGTAFGYMLRQAEPIRPNFLAFVTAHAPFELMAIVLSAAAGLRIGIGWLSTGGVRRIDSMRRAGRRAVPILGVASTLFLMAGLIEAFISGSDVDYTIKLVIALASIVFLLVYFAAPFIRIRDE